METITKILIFVAILLFNLILGLYNSWLIMDLWNWFLVPLGVTPVTSVWAMFGINMLVSWPFTALFINFKPANTEPNESIVNTLAISFVCTASWLLAKFIVYPLSVGV